MSTTLHPLAGALRLNNVALAVSNLDAMIDWYTATLGFTVAERGRFDPVEADFAMIDLKGVRLELVSRVGRAHTPVDRTPVPGHLEVLGWKALVLETNTLADVTAWLESCDVDIVWANQQLTGELHSTMIRDPEGNLINLFGALGQRRLDDE